VSKESEIFAKSEMQNEKTNAKNKGEKMRKFCEKNTEEIL